MTEPELHHDGTSQPTDDGSQDDGHHEQPRKRQRVRLSCLECRRRKLSCSRELPCDRCVKSGTPERCNYESRPNSRKGSGEGTISLAPTAQSGSLSPEFRRLAGNLQTLRHESGSSLSKDAVRDHDRIRKLELEVAQLKNALSKQVSVDGSTIVASPATVKETTRDVAKEVNDFIGKKCPEANKDGCSKQFLNGHGFRTRFYGPHNAWSALQELDGIFPFMKETADVWLRPLNIQKKDRKKRKQDRDKQFAEPDPFLESLLPSREETDSLVAVYLDQFEQLHRIVHVPTFNKEYERFWDPSHTRGASFTALVLSMMAVSCCLGIQASNKFVGVKSSSFQTAEKWIKACSDWCERQSQKHRQLVHYQIVCLLFLAKRVNVIKKKRFWVTIGSMIRESMIVGLHQDPDRLEADIDPYYREMRRRLWATMVEFDIQVSFELGVPTLLNHVHLDADAPKNINDDDFEEDSEELPAPRPRTEYTFSSYLRLSRQSLPLRLELLKVLTGPPADLEWEQILQYVDMITQEIDTLPLWDLEQASHPCQKPICAHALLRLQLKQYLIPLLHPYLKQGKYHSKYQIAELMYYNAARDIVQLHDQLYQRGVRALNFLREDSMTAAVSLCNVSLQQPKASTSLISGNSKETLSLIEKCIELREDRILRCGNNDPWGYSSLCATYGLLETHLGIKTPEAARASSAERFISLHYKLLAYQIPTFQTQESQVQSESTKPGDVHGGPSQNTSISPFPVATPGPTPIGATTFTRDAISGSSMPWLLQPIDPSQLLVPNPELNFDLLDSDLHDLWGEWGGQLN